MPPGSAKRKRSEKQSSEDVGDSRPSPYRPEKSRLSTDPSQQLDDIGTDESSRVPLLSGRDEAERSANTSVLGLNNTAGDRPSTLHFSQPIWTYVTDDFVSKWTEGGYQQFLGAVTVVGTMQVGEIFQELVLSSLEGRLSGQYAGSAVRDIIASHQEVDSELVSLFLNTISLLDDKTHGSSNLRQMVAATGIDAQTMRQELDIPLLQALGLVRSTFDKMRTRKTTNALYRQANFNLLREESEGYAKLITEYFNTAQDASNRREEDPYMAEDAFQRVKALVGAFDLDVGRVLDITLDVSANLLVKAYPFLMKFYRASSWWPDNNSLDNVRWEDQGFGSLPNWALPGSGMSTSSNEDKQRLAILRETRDVQFWARVRDVGLDAFFEIGSRRIVDFDSIASTLDIEIPPELDPRGKETNPSKRLRNNEARKYMRETRTLPPSSNYDAAQLLGFKLRFYASDARDPSDNLPDNVVYFAALLIKIGFISLRDLYPHLYPSDDAMPQEKARLEKEKADKEAKERPGAGSNALAMAAALTDDTLPAARPMRGEKERSGGVTPAQEKKDDPKVELPPPQNQKVLLLKALLLIGALPEALHILGRFPWLVDADISMPQYLHRIAKHMLSKVADLVRPLSNRAGLQEPSEQLSDMASESNGRLKFAPRPSNKKLTRWLHNDGFDEHGVEYRHYYADWSDNIPVCQNIDDVFVLCDTFLGYLGVKIGQDAILYGTLLQIARYSLLKDNTTANRSRWLEVMKRLLVPALSMSKHNSGLTHDLFELLELFPISTRYSIYAEWFTGRTSRLPDIRAAFARNRAEVRDVLRRVSNDSGKRQGRALTKVAFSSPGVVLMEMINQLESYSNMIPSLVECIRYFSDLAHDMLNWCLINSLSGQGRDRIQADGMLTSAWLQALSQFVASLFANYSDLDPSPVLQYLASELRTGNSTDLEMFEQVLVEMAGIRADVEFNEYQISAMAGGKHLQSQILRQLSDTRHTKEKGKTAKRLVKALAEPGLIGQILIAIAQEMKMYAHHESSKLMPLKVLGNNLDKIHAVFAQYLEVLRSNLEPVDFAEHVPDAISLIRDFGIEPGVALTISKVAIRHHMDEVDAIKKNEEQEDKEGSNSEDVKMSGVADEKPASGKESSTTPSQATSNGDESALTDHGKDNPQSLSTKESPWHPALEPIIQRLPDALPNLPNRVSVPFYVTFWSLTYQDVSVPHAAYTKESERLKITIKDIQSDKSDVSAVQAREREKNKKAYLEIQEKLNKEPGQQMIAYMSVKRRLNEEKDHWFPKSTAETKNMKAEIDAKHLGLLQECFLPRAMMSALDAQYSFQMLKILHDNGTKGFSLMHLLFRLFRKQQLTALMFQCTASEAQHFGRFLNEILRLLHWWHADKANYDKEALNGGQLPGFVKKYDVNGEPKMMMDYEEFRRMLFNFHAFLNGALQSCFESGEFMHIRNGIIVLKAVHRLFPAVKFIGQNMTNHLDRLSKEELDKRRDLSIAAMSLFGALKSREKDWILPQAFRMNDAVKDKDAKSHNRASSTQADPPQSMSDGPRLNGAASEFKPNTAALANGNGVRESVAGREDGEIEDEKQAATDLSKRESTNDHSEELKNKKHPGATGNAKLPEAVKQPDQSQNTEATNPKVAKPSTPAASRPASGSNLPSRPDSMRPTSKLPPSDLPAKMTHASPAHRAGGRYPNRLDDRLGRLDRPGDSRSMSREESPANRLRAKSPSATAGRPLYHDERPYNRPPRDDQGVPTTRYDPGGHQSRPARDPHNNINRHPEENLAVERSNRYSSVAVLPDSQAVSRPSSSGTSNTQISRAQPDNAVHVNPARLVLIEGASSNGPNSRGRRDVPITDRDQHRERDIGSEDRTSATNSGARMEGRNSGRLGTDSHRDTGSRPDKQSDLAPTGPKRGRLRDNGPQHESTYGRLNGPSDVPSGPRHHNGPSARGGRTTTIPSPGGHARLNEQTAPPGDFSRPTETPAASRGGPSRQPSSSNLKSEQIVTNSTPNTPVAEPGPTVHPSRAAQLKQPAPIQTTFPNNGSRNSLSASTGPPSGPRGTPRGPTGTPTGGSPTSTFPPSGPASAGERQRRNDRQRATINATLSGGTNGQGVNFRGASSRQSFDGSQATPDSRPAIPAVASSMEPPSSRPSNEIRSFLEEIPANQSNARPDLFQDKNNRIDSSNSRRRGDDRQYSGRDSRPDGFDPTFRGPSGPAADESRPRRVHQRDNRMTNEGPPDLRHGPEQHFRRPPGETMPPFAGSAEWERGSDVRNMRRDGPDDGRRGGGGRSDDFRGPPRREDERREQVTRGPHDVGPLPDGRKRRHDEGHFDPAKRRKGR